MLISTEYRTLKVGQFSIAANIRTKEEIGIMDNTALARFITSLGSLNGYGSTLAQTKKALDLRSSQPLNQHGEDVAIFEDTLKGIAAVKEKGFSVDGIIAINSAFDSPSDEQPNWPGHLRNAYYNEDDRIGITIDQSAKETYFPPEIVRRDDLQKIVDNYKESPKKEKDAWKVFADLSKLQPFQDGNKRTALIAANAAYGTFERENYLVLPFNDLDRGEFTISLMRYYDAKNPTDEAKYLDKMVDLLPSDRERELHRPIISDGSQGKTRVARVKPQFRNVENKESKESTNPKIESRQVKPPFSPLRHDRGPKR